MSFILNVLAIAPAYLWRDYIWTYQTSPITRQEAFSRAFWFHASGAHRRMCGYVAL